METDTDTDTETETAGNLEDYFMLKRYTIKLPEDLHAKAKQQAKDNNLSLSMFIRIALEKFMKGKNGRA